MDEGRPHLGVAIGGHRDADACAADQHTALGLARGHGIGHGCPEVRIVDRLGGVGAEVQHLETRLLQVALENLFQVEAGMIRRDRDGAPRHVDDRSPLAVEPPDTISGAAVSRSPKIVEMALQDIESTEESCCRTVRALRSRRLLPKLDLAGAIAWPNSLGKAGPNNN